MSTCNATLDHTETAKAECGLNIQRRHYFLAPDEKTSWGSRNIRGEDYGSTSSECTSVGSTIRTISIILSSAGDDSLFLSTDPARPPPTRPPNKTYVDQLPRSFVHPAGSQVYQPVICDQQIQYGYNFTPALMGIPSLGYAPVIVQRMPVNIPVPQPLQRQQVVHPMQQCQQSSQNLEHNPLSTTAVPCMMVPVTFPQQNNLETQQASSAVSSTVSTPVLSGFSSPCLNTYGYINTPLVSSASCTPSPRHMTYLDMSPVLDLVKNERISCNINVGPVLSSPETFVSSTTNPPNSQRNKPATSANSLCHKPVAEIEKREATRKEENVWNGNLEYKEYKLNGGSNLFITWPGSKLELIKKLRNFKFEVREVLSTSDKNICNVIFQTHPTARKAFTMQQQIRLRIIPPKNSHRIWFRNPSPTFLVKFETKCRLTVRKGKAESHGIVGELLKGCLITADQLKGNRIRVMCFEGRFMFPGGKIVEMKGVQNKSDKKTSLGWISHRCKYKKESHVIRRSSNMLADYVFN